MASSALSLSHTVASNAAKATTKKKAASRSFSHSNLSFFSSLLHQSPILRSVFFLFFFNVLGNDSPSIAVFSDFWGETCSSYRLGDLNCPNGGPGLQICGRGLVFEGSRMIGFLWIGSFFWVAGLDLDWEVLFLTVQIFIMSFVPICGTRGAIRLLESSGNWSWERRKQL